MEFSGQKSAFRRRHDRLLRRHRNDRASKNDRVFLYRTPGNDRGRVPDPRTITFPVSGTRRSDRRRDAVMVEMVSLCDTEPAPYRDLAEIGRG